MKQHAAIAYDALPDYDDATRVDRVTNFYRHIRTRRTCRDFADNPVPREVIEAALLAAGTAPSGAN
ncbi:MAG TPA: nitroreductase family protein, partial [Sphingorhabdus sp.]|nr:nitroreductase family protein [Sphingorhabdus sp.]